VTGPFTATLNLGAPFKVQTEPYALAAATPAAQYPANSSNGSAKVIVIAMSVVVAGALVFTYRKRPV
jgi:hypothetical protein